MWLLNQGRPSGRSFLLPLRALRPSAIYARLSFFAHSVSLHEIIVPLRLRKWGKEKTPHFCVPSISFQPPLIFLLIGYPCATLALPLGFFCRLGDGSRCRRFTASLSSLHERTVRPSRPSYPRHTQPNILLSVRPRKMPPRPRGLNADVPTRRVAYFRVTSANC